MDFRSKNKVSPNFSMSSMTDIVFLLLIFFMLLSTLVSTNAIDLVLPQGKGKTAKVEAVSLSITNKMKYYINKNQVASTEVKTELKKLLEKSKHPSLIIRAEENVPIKHIVNILDFANQNKYKTVLATRPK